MFGSSLVIPCSHLPPSPTCRYDLLSASSILVMCCRQHVIHSLIYQQAVPNQHGLVPRLLRYIALHRLEYMNIPSREVLRGTNVRNAAGSCAHRLRESAVVTSCCSALVAAAEISRPVTMRSCGRFRHAPSHPSDLAIRTQPAGVFSSLGCVRHFLIKMDNKSSCVAAAAPLP